eukprot:GGOE01013380.1.p1 GENE.GGOE01013380.1~~GGOE01013380.1.p1  ORF type:complete len:1161 (-),score=397.40 GGOE01013380.1:1066-4548(-)
MLDKAPPAIVIPLTLADPSAASPTDAGPMSSGAHTTSEALERMMTTQSMDVPLGNNDALPQEQNEQNGLELLRQVFDSMAVNGKITMDQLPFVLAGAEVQATAEQVHEAIEEFLPDADDEEALLDFDQVQTLFQQLVHVVADHTADALLLAGEEQRTPSALQRMRQWLHHKRKERKMKQTAYERQMKPTTRLLLLILATACIISAAVVVFAVVLIFDHSNNSVINHLVRDTELLSDGLSLFGYTRPFEHTTSNLERLSTILDVVIDELGFNNSKLFQLSNLAYQRDLMGDLVDGWFSNDATSTVDTSVTIVSLWIDRMVARGATLDDLISAFNIMNPNLPSGHEIQLATASSNSDRPTFLTALRFKSGCIGTCGANNGSTALRLALAGGSGTTLTGYDYRPQPVAAGYQLLTNPAGVALAYNVWQNTLQQEFQQPVKAVVDAINVKLASESNNTNADVRVNSQEIVLSSKVSGVTQNLTVLRFCNTTCMKNANLGNSYLALSTNSTGQGSAVDTNGEAIFVAYKPLPNSGLGLSFKISQEEFLDALYLSLGSSLNDVNSKLTGTEELQLVTTPKAGANVSTNGMKYWTNFRFPSTCGSKCGTLANTSTYLKKALTKCVSGTDHSLDYRSQKVIAGYSCVSSMKAAFSITMADSQIISEGTDMAVTIATYQTFVRYAGKSLEIAMARKKPGVVVAKTKNDYEKFGGRKLGDQCVATGCTGPSNVVLAALNSKGGVGYLETVDYRWVTVLAAYTYLPDLDIGIAMKMDKSEAQAGSFRLTGILCGASVSAVLVSMAVLALLANVLLKSMDRAWEEGKRAIEREKQAFRTVIEAMYPAEVAQRMLTGETHIVYDVPAATVFFSDIYEFTTTSNTVTPEELIRFMGYTFGVMDAIGDYYHVYKVKTIGDAYLGATGLPGMTSVNGSATVDLMLFASACAQVFSNRFLHPDEGTILAEVVTRVLKKKNILKSPVPEPMATNIPRRPSIIGYGHPKDAAGVPPPAEDGSGPLVHCIMRYGLAMGPITAGVLQGKTPLFDIWGKTVNLASRMESTGQAGRIQVAEGVYQAVMMCHNQPFTFEGRHKVHCKGFGHVSAYFVDTCLIPPPKDLLVSLHIEPNWGNYLFQNPVPAFGAAKAGSQDPSRRSSNHGSTSPRSQLSHNSHRRF